MDKSTVVVLHTPVFDLQRLRCSQLSDRQTSALLIYLNRRQKGAAGVTGAAVDCQLPPLELLLFMSDHPSSVGAGRGENPLHIVVPTALGGAHYLRWLEKQGVKTGRRTSHEVAFVGFDEVVEFGRDKARVSSWRVASETIITMRGRQAHLPIGGRVASDDVRDVYNISSRYSQRQQL